LVPATAWWKNVRSHVSRADWEKCKAYARAKTNGKCIICHSTGRIQGYRYDVEAHEIWAYDDDNQVQTLVDIIPLCPLCHQCKHLGRTRAVSDPEHWARIIAHFMNTNGWTGYRTEKYIEKVFQIWELRSQLDWELDVSFLDSIDVRSDSGAQSK
jgi:hypothetical protein